MGKETPDLRLIKIKVPDRVKNVLEQAEISGNTLKLTGQLDRPLYVEVDKVLRGLGGKWNRGARAHIFDKDPTEILWTTLETGELLDEKKTFQAFYTPAPLARDLVLMADLAGGRRFCISWLVEIVCL